MNPLNWTPNEGGSFYHLAKLTRGQKEVKHQR